MSAVKAKGVNQITHPHVKGEEGQDWAAITCQGLAGEEATLKETKKE